MKRKKNALHMHLVNKFFFVVCHNIYVIIIFTWLYIQPGDRLMPPLPYLFRPSWLLPSHPATACGCVSTTLSRYVKCSIYLITLPMWLGLFLSSLPCGSCPFLCVYSALTSCCLPVYLPLLASVTVSKFGHLWTVLKFFSSQSCARQCYENIIAPG